jgi:hypothetical protein
MVSGVVDHVERAVAQIERGGIDEGLEGRAGLAQAWVARLNCARDAADLRPPTMARTAPSATSPRSRPAPRSLRDAGVEDVLISASSAAFWMRWSKVVRMMTSSVVSRVRKGAPESITQSAK